MMIDLSTMASLELIQNLQNTKSKECLLGLLNETVTPMGTRFLRSNILQPSTDPEKIRKRQEALTELASKENMFFGVRSGNLHARREDSANGEKPLDPLLMPIVFSLLCVLVPTRPSYS